MSSPNIKPLPVETALAIVENVTGEIVDSTLYGSLASEMPLGLLEKDTILNSFLRPVAKLRIFEIYGDCSLLDLKTAAVESLRSYRVFEGKGADWVLGEHETPDAVKEVLINPKDPAAVQLLATVLRSFPNIRRLSVDIPSICTLRDRDARPATRAEVLENIGVDVDMVGASALIDALINSPVRSAVQDLYLSLILSEEESGKLWPALASKFPDMEVLALSTIARDYDTITVQRSLSQKCNFDKLKVIAIDSYVSALPLFGRVNLPSVTTLMTNNVNSSYVAHLLGELGSQLEHLCIFEDNKKWRAPRALKGMQNLKSAVFPLPWFPLALEIPHKDLSSLRYLGISIGSTPDIDWIELLPDAVSTLTDKMKTRRPREATLTDKTTNAPSEGDRECDRECYPALKIVQLVDVCQTGNRLLRIKARTKNKALTRESEVEAWNCAISKMRKAKVRFLESEGRECRMFN